MPIPGNLLTTAMAVMPHTDSSQAIEAALSLDIPFWPQLPRLSYYEDMYVQASEHFPGILLDLEKQTLSFSMEKFVTELEETLVHFDDPRYFDISHDYSTVYHQFFLKSADYLITLPHARHSSMARRAHPLPSREGKRVVGQTVNSAPTYDS
jgi:hypothetical protein